MKVLVSRDKIWWNIVNENVPSSEYMQSFIDGMEEMDLKVNFNSLFASSIVSKDTNITYIFFNHKGKNYFYYVNSINKILKNGYVLNLELDVWCTYILDYLENMKNVSEEVQSLRSHLFDDKSIQYNDSLLNSCNLQYEDIDVIRKEFNKKGSIYYTEKGAIENADINANTYYVFKDGINGRYTFLPVMSYANKINVYKAKYKLDEKTKTTYIYAPYIRKVFCVDNDKKYGILKYRDSLGVELGKLYLKKNNNINIDTIVKDAYNNNKYIKWSHFSLNTGTSYLPNSIDLNDILTGKYSNGNGNWIDITDRIRYGTLPFMISSNYIKYIILAGTIEDFDVELKLNSIKINKGISKIQWNGWKFINLGDWWRADEVPVDRNIYLSKVDNPISPNDLEYYSWNNKLEDGWRDMGNILKIEIGDKLSDGSYEKYEVNNNIVELDKIKYSQEYSNKFLGVFFLPHILDVIDLTEKININGKDFLSFVIPAEGVFISPFSIFKGRINKWWNKFNNPNIANKNILKYLDYKYYDNNLNVANRINNLKSYSISLGGYLYFTSNAILVSKIKLKSLKDGIISYPYQLPSGTDLYLNYVNSTKNSADTSFNITKQNSIVDGIFGTLNGIGNMITGGLGVANSISINPYTSSSINFGENSKWINAIPNADRALIPIENALTLHQSGKPSFNVDNPLGAYFGLNNMVSGGVNAINSIVNSVLAVNQKEAVLRSHYADKNNTLGNQLVDASSNDAKWLYYNNVSKQYNFIEGRILSANSIKQLNNVILMYGEYYPRIININDIWNIEGLPFRYIQLDKDYLSINFLTYNEAPLNFKDIILNKLDGGVRVWDTNPIYEKYDDLSYQDKHYEDFEDSVEGDINNPELPLPYVDTTFDNISDRLLISNLPYSSLFMLKTYTQGFPFIQHWWELKSSSNKQELQQNGLSPERIRINIKMNYTGILNTNYTFTAFFFENFNDFEEGVDDITINISCNLTIDELRGKVKYLFVNKNYNNTNIISVKFGEYNDKIPVKIYYNGDKIYGK